MHQPGTPSLARAVTCATSECNSFLTSPLTCPLASNHLKKKGLFKAFIKNPRKKRKEKKNLLKHLKCKVGFSFQQHPCCLLSLPVQRFHKKSHSLTDVQIILKRATSDCGGKETAQLSQARTAGL